MPIVSSEVKTYEDICNVVIRELPIISDEGQLDAYFADKEEADKQAEIQATQVAISEGEVNLQKLKDKLDALTKGEVKVDPIVE